MQHDAHWKDCLKGLWVDFLFLVNKSVIKELQFSFVPIFFLIMFYKSSKYNKQFCLFFLIRIFVSQKRKK
jgi:hypothetical protein